MTTTAHPPHRESYDDPAVLLGAIGRLRDERRDLEIAHLRLVLAWADLHCVDPDDAAPEACFTSPKTFAGEGSPVIDEFCVPELATRLGQSCDSTGRLLTEVVELAHRLPRLWARVMAGEVAGWRARTIAATTLDLSVQAVAFVDAQTHWCAGRLTTSELHRVLDTARLRFMPELAARLEDASLDTRHVSIDVEQVGFDGTMGIEARAMIPDVLAFADAISEEAERLKALGSTDTLNGRRAAALGILARRQPVLDLVPDGRGLAVLAARPETEAKEEVWRAFFVDYSVPASRETLILGQTFWRPGQAELLKPFAMRYLEELRTLKGGLLNQGLTIRAMFPLGAGDEEFLAAAQAASEDESLIAYARNQLRSNSYVLSRILAARKL